MGLIFVFFSNYTNYHIAIRFALGWLNFYIKVVLSLFGESFEVIELANRVAYLLNISFSTYLEIGDVSGRWVHCEYNFCSELIILFLSAVFIGIWQLLNRGILFRFNLPLLSIHLFNITLKYSYLIQEFRVLSLFFLQLCIQWSNTLLFLLY
jgi:hypothetical protein